MSLLDDPALIDLLKAVSIDHQQDYLDHATAATTATPSARDSLAVSEDDATLHFDTAIIATSASSELSLSTGGPSSPTDLSSVDSLSLASTGKPSASGGSGAEMAFARRPASVSSQEDSTLPRPGRFGRQNPQNTPTVIRLKRAYTNGEPEQEPEQPKMAQETANEESMSGKPVSKVKALAARFQAGKVQNAAGSTVDHRLEAEMLAGTVVKERVSALGVPEEDEDETASPVAASSSSPSPPASPPSPETAAEEIMDLSGRVLPPADHVVTRQLSYSVTLLSPDQL